MAKVLVVDDSLSVRKVVERALSAKGIDVRSAATGKEAVEQIGREEPDLVVCDVIMPDMDGYQVCEYVKTHPRLARTPVLLISGIVNGAVLERAAQVRSDDVMYKPFTAAGLVSEVERLLEFAAPEPEPVSAMASASGAAVSAAAEPEPPLEAAPAPAAELGTSLGMLADLPGVTLSVLFDREGFLIESAGPMKPEAEVAAALASCLAESSGPMGRDLRQGPLQSMIIEYESGIVLLHGVDSTAMLAVMLRDSAALGKVRYYMKKVLPDLQYCLGRPCCKSLAEHEMR
jgi:CheY-like chemotaxis protein